jgi:TetR/AcrR family transcriptional repressor of uid operon
LKISDKGQVRRQQIMEAAATCFKRSGFHGASMADIAKSFGMSAGHIYNYFDSKEAIIEAIVAQDLEDTLGQIENLSKQEDMFKAILDGVQASLQRRAARVVLDIEVLAEASRNPKVASALEKTDKEIRLKLSKLIDSIDKKEKKTSCNSAKATLILALFEGLMIRTIRDPQMNQATLSPLLQNMIGHLLNEN